MAMKSQGMLQSEEIERRLNQCNRILHRVDIQSEEAYECISKVKTDLEDLMLYTNTSELLPCLEKLLDNDVAQILQMILCHVLTISEHSEIVTALKLTFKYYPFKWYHHLNCYLDLFFQGESPELSFCIIHEIWNIFPFIEFRLKLLYCKRLLDGEHYEILNHLIQNDEEYFTNTCVPLLEEYLEDLIVEPIISITEESLYATHITVLLLLLSHFVTKRNEPKLTSVLRIMEQFISESSCYSFINTHIYKGFADFMHTLSRKQIMLMPYLIKLLQHLLVTTELKFMIVEIILFCSERLSQVNCFQESMDLIKDNSHFILSLPLNMVDTKCEQRQNHCILLLMLLNAYARSGDSTNMEHVLNKLQNFRTSLFSCRNNEWCYCFMGAHSCKQNMDTIQKSFKHLWPHSSTKSENERRFQCLLMERIYGKPTFFIPENFTLIYKVTHGELNLARYLKSTIDIMKDNMEDFKEVLLREFTLLIEMVSKDNENGLYDIIRTLCVLKIVPEVKDIFIQGLTEFLNSNIQVSRQHFIISTLLLDINMTCSKGEFLQKLTISMGKVLYPFEEDITKDVNTVIYRSFCVVRHENKTNYNNNATIPKYKENFPFITAMETEAEMEKLSGQRSFLAMLIILTISVGGLLKLAQLKKYLSQKYAYEDAILYLLWCSGDVEINPGPTFKKLKKQANSVKKRNWIHEMCTIALKVLKDKSVDSKVDGLWQDRPDNWQELHGDKPFYDPRNKPKNKKYGIKTDKELLTCLLKCCDEKSVKFPTNFEREITAWNKDITFLYELFVTRQEIDTMKMAKDLLIVYRDTPELKHKLKDSNVCISFKPKSTQGEGEKGYSDILRDLAITFCRISQDLPIFEKCDGIWKTPDDWNPNHLYYSPCNTTDRQKDQDKEFVENLLNYCKMRKKLIPPELKPVVKAWDQRDIHEIYKHYTIWSSMAIIQNSLSYLELEDLLEKQHVQQSLKQIGISRYIEIGVFNHDIDDSSQDSGYRGTPDNSASDSSSQTSYPVSVVSDLDTFCSKSPNHVCVIVDNYTKVSEIKNPESKCQIQPKKSICTKISKKSPSQDDRDVIKDKDKRVQKRKLTDGDDRANKRLVLHTGNQSHSSTLQINICNAETTKSLHQDNTDQSADRHVTVVDQSDQVYNPTRMQIQNTLPSNDPVSVSKDLSPELLHEYTFDDINCNNLEEELKDIESFTDMGIDDMLDLYR